MHPRVVRGCAALQAVLTVAAVSVLVFVGTSQLGEPSNTPLVVFLGGEVLVAAAPALALMWGHNEPVASKAGVTAVVAWKLVGLAVLAFKRTRTQSGVLWVTATVVVCVAAAVLAAGAVWAPLLPGRQSHTGTIRLARRFAAYHGLVVVPQIAAVSSSASLGSRLWTLVVVDIGLCLALAAGCIEAVVAHRSQLHARRMSPTRVKLLLLFAVVGVATKGVLTGFVRTASPHDNPALYWTAVGSVAWFFTLATGTLALASVRAGAARVYLRSLLTAVIDRPIINPANSQPDLGPVVLLLLPTAVHWLLFVSVPGGVMFGYLHPELYTHAPPPDAPSVHLAASPCYGDDYRQLVAVYLCGAASLALLCAARIMEAGSLVTSFKYTVWFLATSAFTAATMVQHAFGLYGLVMSSHCDNALFTLTLSTHSLFVFTWLVLCLVYIVGLVHRDTRRRTDVFWEIFAARSVYFSQSCVRSLALNFGRICACLCLTSPVIGLLSFVGVALTARRLSGESVRSSLANEGDRDDVKSMMWMVAACVVSVYSVFGSVALAVSTRFHRPRRALLYAHFCVTLGCQLGLLPYEWSLWRDDDDRVPRSTHEHTRHVLFRLAIAIRVFLFCNLIMLIGLVVWSMLGGGRRTTTLFNAALKDAISFRTQLDKLEAAMQTVVLATSIHSIAAAMRDMEAVLVSEPSLRRRVDRHKAAMLFETKQRRHPNLYTWSTAAAALQLLRRVYGGDGVGGGIGAGGGVRGNQLSAIQ